MIEGIVAMGVFFLLITLIVQVGFLIVARSMVGASVDGAARRVAWTMDGDFEVRDRVQAEIAASVPGVETSSVTIERLAEDVTVSVSYTWFPPGPNLVPVTFTVDRSRSIAVPP